MSEIPTELDLATIAKAIGNGWEMLAAFLSIDQPKVERIKMRYPHFTAQQVFQLLLTWRRIQCNAASFDELFKSMQECGSVSVDWDMLETTLGSRFGMCLFLLSTEVLICFIVFYLF